MSVSADPIPVVVDCDPGVDDAFALAYACASPAIDLRAVTAACGNADIATTTRNALSLLELFGHGGVPVGRGAEASRTPGREIDPAVHGVGGLGGVRLPEPESRPAKLDAIDLIAEVVEASRTPVTLVATGPLTNIADFLQTHPEGASHVRQIALMGGSLGAGNVTEAAEFNVWFDPLAASVVYSSGLPILMAGLDVTEIAVIDPDDELSGDAPVPATLREMYRHYADFYRDEFGVRETPLHDVVPIHALVEPHGVSTARCAIDVETEGAQVGRTVPRFGPNIREGNVIAILDLDVSAFRTALADAIATLGDR